MTNAPVGVLDRQPHRGGVQFFVRQQKKGGRRTRRQTRSNLCPNNGREGRKTVGFAMEARFAPTFFLCAGLGLLALFLAYRALPSNLLSCNSFTFGSGDPWSIAEDNVDSNDSEQTIAQFLQQKIRKRSGLLEIQDESNDLAGLDYSSRALLTELIQSLSRSSAESANQPEEWGLLNFDYGVARVVRRLVVCSAYRTSMQEFTVVTLSPDFTMPTANPDFKGVPPKDPAVTRTCTWLEGGGSGAPRFASSQEMNETGRGVIGTGVAQFGWIGESHATSYDVLLISCKFPKPVGADLLGGFLYLNFTHGPGNSAPTELAPVFRERPGALNASLFIEERKDFQYEYAYCSGPIFTILTADHVKQFLMYHYALLEGKVHFFVYDSRGIDPETMAVLQPMVDAGVVTVVNYHKESEYDTWYHSQDLAINDCLFRVRSVAKWVLSWDMDEYLHVRPPLTLPALLEDHKDAPWISFGKIDFELSHCSPFGNDSSDVWAVERMLYRHPKPICGELCNGDKGARKWIANPRKVSAGRIHAVADASKGLILSTKVARMNHYRGLVAPRGRFRCQEIRDPLVSNVTKGLDGRTVLRRDSELASIVSSTLRSSVQALPMFGSSS